MLHRSPIELIILAMNFIIKIMIIDFQVAVLIKIIRRTSGKQLMSLVDMLEENHMYNNLEGKLREFTNQEKIVEIQLI